jgi:hypothetical protein
MIQKKEIFKKLMEQLQENSQINQKEIDSVTDAAIDAPGRNESRYDSSKTELGNLANSLSQKMAGLEETIKQLTAFSLPEKCERVLMGSLIEISAPGKKLILFLLPSGGGIKVKVDELEILTISKSAPLFNSIINKKVGEAVNFNKQVFKIEKVN